MSKIKTKEAVKGTIKTIDKAAVASERMKAAYAKTKDKAESGMYAQETSADEYAADRVQNAEDRIIHEGVYAFDKEGRKGFETTKDNAIKLKDSIQSFQQKRAEKALHTQQGPSHSTPSPSKSGYSNGKIPTTSRVQTPIKTVPKAEKTIRQSARSAGRRTIKTVDTVSTKAVGKSVKTAEKTA